MLVRILQVASIFSVVAAAGCGLYSVIAVKWLEYQSDDTRYVFGLFVICENGECQKNTDPSSYIVSCQVIMLISVIISCLCIIGGIVAILKNVHYLLTWVGKCMVFAGVFALGGGLSFKIGLISISMLPDVYSFGSAFILSWVSGVIGLIAGFLCISAGISTDPNESYRNF